MIGISKGENMKVLVVFYSYDGNTALIAQTIAETLHADSEELKPLKPSPHHKGLMKYVWNGRAAVMKDTPELQPLQHSPSEYDLIFLGTPVWVGQWAPPFNTFFQHYPLTGKKVACFFCHAGGPGAIEKRFRKQLVSSSILGFAGFIDPLWSKRQTEQLEKARIWAREMLELASNDNRTQKEPL